VKKVHYRTHPNTGTTLNVGPYNRKERLYNTDLEGRTVVFGCTEIKATTAQTSRQLVGIYCFLQVHTEGDSSKSRHIYQVFVIVFLAELGRTTMAQFSRQFDTHFKEDFVQYGFRRSYCCFWLHRNRGFYSTDFEAACRYLLVETSLYRRGSYSSKSGHIYRGFVTVFLAELGRTAVAQTKG
jgi:hypothetical protein